MFFVLSANKKRAPRTFPMLMFVLVGVLIPFCLRSWISSFVPKLSCFLYTYLQIFIHVFIRNSVTRSCVVLIADRAKFWLAGYRNARIFWLHVYDYAYWRLGKINRLSEWRFLSVWLIWFSIRLSFIQDFSPNLGWGKNNWDIYICP